jgi:spore maturation protein CgeB
MMRVAFFGSSLLSAYWNGAATYYRGILRALAGRGHQITFLEPDAFERQTHRDMDEPPWAKVIVYPATVAGVNDAIDRAAGSDLVIKASGVGVFDDYLEAVVANMRAPSTMAAFWDVDAPATLDRVHRNENDPFAALIPQYDVVFTYGGGPPVVEAYCDLGARRCVPVYNALDPSTHFAVGPDPRFEAALAFLGNRLPDREKRVEEFFLFPASRLPKHRFLLGGAGWQDKPRSPNVRWLDHVYTRDHNSFNSTPSAVLNISRDSMARYGFSPATRVFEAAGARACLITDAWEGIELFLEPGKEVLVAKDGAGVIDHLGALSSLQARQIGEAAYRRVISQHTYEHRAAAVESVLEGKALVGAIS